MDIPRKIELAAASVKSISTHNDATPAERHKALESLVKLIATERAELDKQGQELAAVKRVKKG